MSHTQRKPTPGTTERTRSRPRSRPAVILGSTLICLAALGMRADPGLPGAWLRSVRVPTWLASAHGTAPLKNALESVASMSDAAIDSASLLVLGLSLVGGGRMIRRVGQQLTQRPGSVDGGSRSRPPALSTYVGPRRIAR
jgi:hypothetical protein